MAMDKAIEHKKEHRKPYKGSKAIDCQCRNHGSCTWCLENRIYKYQKINEKTLDMIREFWYNEYNK
jgi:hypothetical protein